MKMHCVFFLLGAVGAVELAENPIRRIVNLLQATQKKVEEEGREQEDMFEKYMCYCQTNTKALEQSISDLNDQGPQIEASIKGLTELKAQLDEELKQHKTDRSDAQASIESATAQREKDKAAFDAYSTETKTNLAACDKAEKAIRKGMGESFLQSAEVSVLQRAVVAAKSLSNFLPHLAKGHRSNTSCIVALKNSDRVGHRCRCIGQVSLSLLGDAVLLRPQVQKLLKPLLCLGNLASDRRKLTIQRRLELLVRIQLRCLSQDDTFLRLNEGVTVFDRILTKLVIRVPIRLVLCLVSRERTDHRIQQSDHCL